MFWHIFNVRNSLTMGREWQGTKNLGITGIDCSNSQNTLNMFLKCKLLSFTTWQPWTSAGHGPSGERQECSLLFVLGASAQVGAPRTVPRPARSAPLTRLRLLLGSILESLSLTQYTFVSIFLVLEHKDRQIFTLTTHKTDCTQFSLY